MPITPRDWENFPSTATPITAEALEAMYTDIGEYVDNDSDPAVGLLDKADNATRAASGLGYVNHGVSASVARPIGYAAVLWLGSVEPTNAANNDVWIDTT